MTDEDGTATTDPEVRVRQYVRRLDSRDTHRYTPWAQIAMTVPSASGICWLVCFIDGEVDVWRVDDESAAYQFRSTDSPETGAQSK
ncbi:hypothetical protein [Mycobacterium sp. UM_WWY]